MKKYFWTFLIVLAILFSLLIITAMIPKQLISENIKESTSAFKTGAAVYEIQKRRDYTFLDHYADAMLLNIIYCIDSQNPLESVMEAKFYSEYNDTIISYDFEELVENNFAGNVEYLRYWHGSMSIVRPLLLFFNLQQIYILMAIILSVLVLALIILLLRKKQIALTITFVIGLIMCFAILIPFCLEYTWAFLIMLITTIIALLIEKNDKKLNILFFITGMVVCYLDFLTTEIITILVPVIVILTIRYKEQRITSFKQGIIFIIRSCILWGISYVGMWLSKWILASIILKINAFDYVIENALYRINGEVLGVEEPILPLRAIRMNLFALYPINIQKRRIKLIVIPIIMIIIELIFVRKKDLKKLWISGLLLMVAFIPYVRFFVLANHSFKHYFFTFRTQIITIMALLLAMLFSFDKEILKKEIRFRNNNKLEKKKR